MEDSPEAEPAALPIDMAACPSLEFVDKQASVKLEQDEDFVLAPPETTLDEKFVFPWMGILVNVPTEFRDGRHVGESGTKLKEQLRRFNPRKVVPLWNDIGHTGNAIVIFNKDWTGFKDALAFENHFEARHFSKKDWHKRQSCCPGDELYGWIARARDYILKDPIGEYLQKNGDLKTLPDLEKQGTRLTEILMVHLENTIEAMDKNLVELEAKCNETDLLRERLMLEKDQLHQKYNEGDPGVGAEVEYTEEGAAAEEQFVEVAEEVEAGGRCVDQRVLR